MVVVPTEQPTVTSTVSGYSNSAEHSVISSGVACIDLARADAFGSQNKMAMAFASFQYRLLRIASSPEHFS
jgi:hypothetical protein